MDPTEAGVAVYTSITIEYLDRALVLLRTARSVHPLWRFFAVVVDEGPIVSANRRALDEFDGVILARDLGIPDFEQWIFGHGVVEACTAVKGAALEHLLRAGYDKVVYLDPDMAVLGPLDPITGALDEASIVLTPHLLKPETEKWAVAAHEIGALRHGIYNFGCYAVANDATGRDFARWWSQRLYDFCLDEPGRGLFTDQKWGNHVPVFFPSTAVCTDPGINVASWNLRQRPVTLANGVYHAAGTNLRLFHFTKALTVGPAETERNAPGDAVVAELWRWYLDAVSAAQADVRKAPWTYSNYEDGTPIAPRHRREYRNSDELKRTYPHPRSCAAPSLAAHFRSLE